MASEGVARPTRKGRPNHPIELKRRLAALACSPAVSVAKLALEHGLNANLVFRWRRQYRAGHFGAVEPLPVTGVKLLPVVNAKLAPVHVSVRAGRPVIEIVVGAATVRLCNGVDGEALRTVLDCLAHRT
jgi:transposase